MILILGLSWVTIWLIPIYWENIKYIGVNQTVDSNIFYGFVFVFLSCSLGLFSGFTDKAIHLIFVWGSHSLPTDEKVTISVN